MSGLRLAMLGVNCELLNVQDYGGNKFSLFEPHMPQHYWSIVCTELFYLCTSGTF